MPTYQQKIATRGVEALLLAYGDVEQIRAWRGGTLIEDEIVDVARRVAFLTFDNFTRYRRLERHEVQHRTNGTLCGGHDLVTFRSIDHVGSFLGAEFADYRRFIAAAARAPASWSDLASYFTLPQLADRMHIAECPECHVSKQRRSVLVTVHWAGRPLSREYMLGGGS